MTTPSDALREVITRTAAAVRYDGQRLLGYADWLEKLATDPEIGSETLMTIHSQLHGLAGALSALASQLTREDER